MGHVLNSFVLFLGVRDALDLAIHVGWRVENMSFRVSQTHFLAPTPDLQCVLGQA